MDVVIVSANDGDSERDLPVVLINASANDGDSERDIDFDFVVVIVSANDGDSDLPRVIATSSVNVIVSEFAWLVKGTITNPAVAQSVVVDRVDQKSFVPALASVLFTK